MEGQDVSLMQEGTLDKRIREFQTLFGIVDEGSIVSNDDYEASHALSYDDMNAGTERAYE